MMSVIRQVAVRAWFALVVVLPVVVAACNNKGGGPGY
jgi:predicted small secreted protein